MRGIKQSCIHDVQRQLQQMIYIERFENLSCTCTISYRLVVANGRIVSEASFLESDWRFGIEVQPMHPSAYVIRACYLLNTLAFNTALCVIAPCIDAVDSYFTLCKMEFLQVPRDIGQVIARGTLCSRSSLRIEARIALYGNNKKC